MTKDKIEQGRTFRSMKAILFRYSRELQGYRIAYGDKTDLFYLIDKDDRDYERFDCTIQSFKQLKTKAQTINFMGNTKCV